jgi:hypothetical protein
MMHLLVLIKFVVNFTMHGINDVNVVKNRIRKTCNEIFKPLNAELNPICHLLALLGAHHIFHFSGLTVKLGSCKIK